MSVSRVHCSPTFSPITVPPCAEDIFRQMKSAWDRSRLEPSDSEAFHGSRSGVYTFLTILQRHLTHSTPPAFNSDLGLSKAEKVATGLLFKDYPGSENRLMPLAKDYLRKHQHLEFCLAQPVFGDGVDFIYTVQSIAKSHQAFVEAYATEIAVVSKHQPDYVSIAYRSDIEFFVKAFLDSLAAQAWENLSSLREKIRDRDAAFVFQFYDLALESALSSADCTTSLKLFQPFQDQFEQLSAQYKELSVEERVILRSCLAGREGELSRAGKEMLAGIQSSAIHWQRDASQSPLYSAMLYSIYRLSGASLSLAHALRSGVIDDPDSIPQNMDAIVRILFFAGLQVDSKEEDCFDFFKEKEVLYLQKRFRESSKEEIEKIKSEIFKPQSNYLLTMTQPAASSLLKHIVHYSEKLSSHCDFKIVGGLLKLVR